MKLLTGKKVIMHCCISLGYIEQRAKEGKSLFDGLTPSQALEEVSKARAKGLEYWPGCDNTDSTGHCAGHQEAK